MWIWFSGYCGSSVSENDSFEFRNQNLRSLWQTDILAIPVMMLVPNYINLCLFFHLFFFLGGGDNIGAWVTTDLPYNLTQICSANFPKTPSTCFGYKYKLHTFLSTNMTCHLDLCFEPLSVRESCCTVWFVWLGRLSSSRLSRPPDTHAREAQHSCHMAKTDTSWTSGGRLL